MLLMHRNKSCAAKTVCISVGVLLAAHIAAGVILCKGMPKQSRLCRMMKKAKRTAVGFVKEIF
ncbi:MAG: hypothetical protein J6C26_03680 [Clostridia bacterium]|nr:hypothetical protein [Clostridia bacterium]MBQ4322555.1 hypothetical protein [Clostridia bacterium]